MRPSMKVIKWQSVLVKKVFRLSQPPVVNYFFKQLHAILGKNCKVSSIGLSIVWVASFLILAAIGFTVRTKNAIATGDLHGNPLHSYPLFVLFMAIFYFLPLLPAILHHAKEAKLKPIIIIARIVLIVLCAWIPLSLLVTILTSVGAVP